MKHKKITFGLCVFFLVILALCVLRHVFCEDAFRLAAKGDLIALNFCDEKKFFTPNRLGRTPIFYSANPQIIDFFMRRGVDIDRCIDYEGVSLLECFCMDNKTDNIKKILPHVKNINHQDVIGGTALVWAIIRENYEIVELLLSNGADPALQLSNGMIAKDVASKNVNKNQKIIDLIDKYWQRNLPDGK